MQYNRKQAGTRVAGQAAGGQFDTTVRTEPTGTALHSEPAQTRPEWAEHQSLRHLRGHDFYPSATQLARIPEVYSSQDGPVGLEGQVCHARYLLAHGEFLVVELDRGSGEAYGILTDRDGESKLTSVNLPAAEAGWSESEGQSMIAHRDGNFQPQRAAAVHPQRMGGRATMRLSRLEFRALESQYEKWRAHQLLAHGADFDISDLETHHARGQELEALWQSRAAGHGVFLHSGDLGVTFRDIRSTNRGDWVDDEVWELQEG